MCLNGVGATSAALSDGYAGASGVAGKACVAVAAVGATNMPDQAGLVQRSTLRLAAGTAGQKCLIGRTCARRCKGLASSLH